MSAKKYVVRLTGKQRIDISTVVRSQKATSQASRRARILLLSDAEHVEGRRPDWQIAEIVGLSEKQVKRIRQQFAQQGVQESLQRKQRSDAGTPQKMDGAVEAQLVTLCCSAPPEGHQRWTLSLLVDELCRLKVVASVCRETVRQTLKKIVLSRGERNVSAFLKKTVLVSLHTWNESSKPIKKATRTAIR